jgi:excinuclease ABC subunit C
MPDTTQPDQPPQPAIATGVAAILAVLKTLPDAPGVYRMLDAGQNVLYVGKAKSLKKRVVAYTRLEQLPARLQRMVLQTRSMEIVTTQSEVEALLLESNLIKSLNPKYNILLKDDKSFPYIVVTKDDAYPRIMKHRGQKRIPGTYFGPFASAGAVNQTLTWLEKAFLLRSCADTVFRNRTRPCLLYQIKRCAAPCVDYISPADYRALCDQAVAYISGKSQGLQASLAAKMEQASAALNFEDAAIYRDRIQAITAIQSHQDINPETLPFGDVIAAHQAGGQTAIQIFFFRGGRNHGTRSYFPSHAQDAALTEVLEAFIGQFYARNPPPREILVSHALPHADLAAAGLAERAGHKVVLSTPQRGDKRRLISHALKNAEDALARKLAESTAQSKLLQGVADAFGLEAAPQRIEIYDNSHLGGTRPLGAMVVAGPEGFIKTAYRTFHMDKENLPAGDDYGMMRRMLERRLKRSQQEDPNRLTDQWPDLLLIDGGQGQLAVVMEVLEDLALTDIPVVAIAKGPERNAGRERFFMPGQTPFSMPENSPVLYYLQRLRDEAHRFAIGTQRKRRTKDMHSNPLDAIAGVGPKRKKALLHHFGSAKAVAAAGLDDLQKTPGINANIAQLVYDHFHGA